MIGGKEDTVETGRRSAGRFDSARPPGVGVIPALAGVGRMLWALLTAPFVGRRRLRWGTVGTEASDPLPGDDLVAEPRWTYTMAVGVDASPEAVWPWIAQIGQGRGGFYTYQTLENLVGCRVVNTTEILPEHQHPAVGDHVRLHPDTPPLRVEVVDPPTAFVLFGSPADVGAEDSWGASTWQFIVRPGPEGGSRFLTRGRYDYTSDWKSRLAFGSVLIKTISYVMSRRMMLEIKRLAERGVGSD